MPNYSHHQLIEFAKELLIKAGLSDIPAKITAEKLVEADLMGHNTHGLAMLNPYLEEIMGGGMKNSGNPLVVKDQGASITWDGQYLPGCWLTHQAIDLAFERIQDHPTVTMAISKSHHIGCLATYPERATEKGLIMILSCSDPNNATVAPFGGLDGLYSPNPIAYGVPTKGKPIIVDISMSSTANGLINQSHSQGKKLPHPWLLDNQGKKTNDPATFFEDPPSTILPLGGLDIGYKGFGLGLLVEMLTSGLSGHGRADHPTRWGASVFLQIINPEAFGGLDKFIEQSQFLSDTCIESKPLDSDKPVRLPGNRALALRAQRKKNGIPLNNEIVGNLKLWGENLGVSSDAF